MKNLLVLLPLLFVGCGFGTIGTVPLEENGMAPSDANEASFDGDITNSSEGGVANGSSDANFGMDADNYTDVVNGPDAETLLPETGAVKDAALEDSSTSPKDSGSPDANVFCQNEYDDCMTVCCLLHGEESGNGPCSQLCERTFQACENKDSCRR